MNDNSQTNISDTGYLYEKDTIGSGGKGVEGQLSFNPKELKFDLADGSRHINIPINSIIDADFTNIFAKVQFIITTSDKTTYIFGFAKPATLKSAIWAMNRPFNGLLGLKATSETVSKAMQWKEVFGRNVPQTVFRTRKEVQLKNILLGSLFGTIVLIGALVLLVTLLSKK